MLRTASLEFPLLSLHSVTVEFTSLEMVDESLASNQTCKPAMVVDLELHSSYWNSIPTKPKDLIPVFGEDENQ